MQTITPFMWFDRNAEEAINFYTSVFKNSKIISIKRYPDGPLEGPMKGFEGKVLTAVFELDGSQFMALDGGDFFKPSGAISYLVSCDTQEQVDHYWNALSADPAAEQCGWLKDKYGFTWQINPKRLPELLSDPDPVKAGRVMQAMMQMKKIDIAALERAYNAEA